MNKMFRKIGNPHFRFPGNFSRLFPKRLHRFKCRNIDNDSGTVAKFFLNFPNSDFAPLPSRMKRLYQEQYILLLGIGYDIRKFLVFNGKIAEFRELFLLQIQEFISSVTNIQDLRPHSE